MKTERPDERLRICKTVGLEAQKVLYPIFLVSGYLGSDPYIPGFSPAASRLELSGWLQNIDMDHSLFVITGF